MFTIFCFVIGIFIGVLIARIFIRPSIVGTLRLDQSDPDSGPYLFMEIEKGGMQKIYNEKYVTMKVEIRDYISRD